MNRQGKEMVKWMISTTLLIVGILCITLIIMYIKVVIKVVFIIFALLLFGWLVNIIKKGIDRYLENKKKVDSDYIAFKESMNNKNKNKNNEC